MELFMFFNRESCFLYNFLKRAMREYGIYA